MGAFLAVSGALPATEAQRRIRAMAAQSPYRGRLQIFPFPGLTVGLQRVSTEASAIDEPDVFVAINGRECALLGPGDASRVASSAARIACVWREQGLSCLSAIDGDYALLVYDKRHATAHVAVSLLMMRPLYYAITGEALVLASEVRQVAVGAGIRRRLDEQQVFLSFWLNRPLLGKERTEYQNINRLLSPHVYQIKAGVRQLENVGIYWTQPGYAADPAKAREALPEAVLETLGRSIRNLDGQVALSLSAGHDSGTLWAVSMRQPPRSGTPRFYTWTYPWLDGDEAVLVRRMLSPHGLGTCTVDGSQGEIAARVAEHVASLDRIPVVSTLFLLDRMLSVMRRDGIDSNIVGAAGELSLMIEPYYLVDLLRRGRWLAFLRDISRFELSMLENPTRLRRARRLLGFALRPLLQALNGGHLRAHGTFFDTRWQALYRQAVATLPLLEPGGDFGRAYHWHLIESFGISGGTETAEQFWARYGIELVTPYTTRRLTELVLRIPPRLLCRGRYDRQVQREVAELALGYEPPWPRRKISLISKYDTVSPLVQGLGPARKWALVEAGIISEQSARALDADVAEGRQPTPRWGRAAYYEHFMRKFGG
jgi:asparagine synthetase B (glutamine-hydrolysing)